MHRAVLLKVLVHKKSSGNLFKMSFLWPISRVSDVEIIVMGSKTFASDKLQVKYY